MSFAEVILDLLRRGVHRDRPHWRAIREYGLDFIQAQLVDCYFEGVVR